MSDRSPQLPDLPSKWQLVRAEVIYRTSKGMCVQFDAEQLRLSTLYDPSSKHLRAINKGLVATKGKTGLVSSEELGYDFKSKILGKGGDRRFHGKIVEGILYFPGKMTTH